MAEKTSLYNKLLEIIKMQNIQENVEKAYKSILHFKSGKAVIIEKEKARKYLNLLSELYESNKEINCSFALETFEKKVTELTTTKKIRNSGGFTLDEIREFENQLISSNPLQKAVVMSAIQGIYLKNNKPYSIGKFTIFHFPAHQTYEPYFSKDWLFGEKSEGFYLKYQAIETRDHLKGMQIANERFNDFVLILNFIIGTRNKRYQVLVQDQSIEEMLPKIYYISEQKTSMSLQRDITEPLPIDDEYFINEESGFNRIWEFVGATDICEMHKKIYKAILWVGKSISARQIEAAFLNVMIALEILFSKSEAGLFRESIGQNIADAIAFIIGEAVSDRVIIEGEIKRLYGYRSKIVHSGAEITEEDYNKVLAYTRLSIINLLTKEEYRKMESINQFTDNLKKKKYS